MAVINNENRLAPSSVMEIISNDIGIFDKYVVYCSDYSNYNESTYVLIKSTLGTEGYTMYTYSYNSTNGTVSRTNTSSGDSFPEVRANVYCYSNINGQGRTFDLPYMEQLNTIALWFMALTLMIGVLLSCLHSRKRA